MKPYEKHINANRGFTLVETLLGMSCVFVASLLFVPLVSIMADIQKPSYASEDRIAIAQLRFLLAQSKDISLQDNTMIFSYQKKQQHLSYDRQRLVRQDGYEIFLQHVDQIQFQEQNKCIYVRWKRGKKQQQALLVCR